MSRNLTAMSKEIFRRILAAAVADDAYFSADENARWIKRLNDEDAELMAKSEVEVLPLGMKSMAARIAYNQDSYYCFSGIPLPEDVPSGPMPISPTPGLFAAVITASTLPAQATVSQVRDVTEEMYRGIPGYDGHALEQIMHLYPSLNYYIVDKESDQIYLNRLERVAGAYCAKGYPGHPLPMSDSTKKEITSLFESGEETVPYGLLLQGLFSYGWPAFYLDLYRCIEQLYSLPRLEALARNIRHNGTMSDLAAVLESTLSWRPREEESLSYLLSEISEHTRDLLLDPFAESGNASVAATGEKCARKVYEFRNAHVHFRPALKAVKMDDDRWNKLISAMCLAIGEIYSEHGSKFLIKQTGIGSEISNSVPA